MGLAITEGDGCASGTEVVAMRDATMHVKQGEVVALLGPSGSGKSTFLTAVGLINPPTAGRIAIGGKLVQDGDTSHTNLIPFLSAAENIQIAMELNGESKRAARIRAIELMENLGVADRADNLPSMLSGGQQQRIAVSRAIANRPSVILADEPTAALDGERGRQVMELFARVSHEQGAGVIVVTHGNRALDVFDTIYKMEDGNMQKDERNADTVVR